MLFILLSFRGNVDKEDNTEDKSDSPQKQPVSPAAVFLSTWCSGSRRVLVSAAGLGSLVAVLQLHCICPAF